MNVIIYMHRQVKQCQNDECNYIHVHVQASKTMSKSCM